MTTLYLVRHADHALLGEVLVGRGEGVPLCATGVDQAQRLAAHFAPRHVSLVQSSPRQRALQTAEPIGANLGLDVEIAEPLDEVDFGTWTGRSFMELGSDGRWSEWNRERGTARPPGGESMKELQERVVAHLGAMSQRLPEAHIVLVTHAEVIRAAILHIAGLPLDSFAQVDVPPASVTTVRMKSTRPTVVVVTQKVH